MNDDAHQIEPELLQAPPRKIVRRRIGPENVILRVFSALLLIAFFYFLKVAIFTTLISFYGVTMPAQIVERKISTTGKGRWSYDIYYEYNLGGAFQTDHQDVGSDSY